MFVTAEPQAYVRFGERSTDGLSGWPRMQLVTFRTSRLWTHCSSSICTAERGSPKFEPAARRWLVRYLSEGSPGLKDVATVTASLAKRADMS
jgi:hypothetical protein